MTEDNYEHLAWFLGPKAENAVLTEELFLLIFRDYIHWRRNYFPSDPILLNQSLQRGHIKEHDALNEKVHRLLADLRRNFPFYSPRYFAHQLSDTLIPAILGYFAGMLFNPNNVTAEAAPVTVDLEVQACNAILEMLGFTAPPRLPTPKDDLDIFYRQHSRTEFGWAHITSGGTVANIEAFWVARQIRYFPLAVRDVIMKRRSQPAEMQFNIDIKLPDGSSHPITDISDRQLLNLKPNESIFLLPKWVQAVREIDPGEHPDDPIAIGNRAWDLLGESEFGLAKGVGALFSKYPAFILVPGTSHYSIEKAANLIGVGSARVIRVKTDARFRMDVADLEHCLEARVLAQGGVPVCVVANAGTTEEGAVDPIHEIIDLRERLEKEKNISFWLHVDAAWGGYIRSLFQMEPATSARVHMAKISTALQLPMPHEGPEHWNEWHSQFSNRIESRCVREDSALTPQAGQSPKLPPDHAEPRHPEEPSGAKWIRKHLHHMLDELQNRHYARYADMLRAFPNQLKKVGLIALDSETAKSFSLTFDDRCEQLRSFVSDDLEFRVTCQQQEGTTRTYQRSVKISWPSNEVCAAFLRFDRADSITVDPHKMGYMPYPCGCIAFRNDRVRHFVLQSAPYITASKHSPLVHVPPIRIELVNGKRTQKRDAFGSFILEGSKPGAAAAGLWLAVNTIPLSKSITA